MAKKSHKQLIAEELAAQEAGNAKKKSRLDEIMIEPGGNEFIGTGILLRTRRESMGLTIEQVAHAAGVSNMTVSRAENDTKITKERFEKIADVLNLRFDTSEVTPPIAPEPSSPIFNARALVLHDLMTGEIPQIHLVNGRLVPVNIREFVETKWREPVFHNLRISRNELELFWEMMISDGYLQHIDGTMYVYRDPALFEFLEMKAYQITFSVSAAETIHRLPKYHNEATVAQMNAALEDCRTRQYHPSKFVESMMAFVVALCHGNSRLLPIGFAYSEMSRQLFELIHAILPKIWDDKGYDMFFGQFMRLLIDEMELLVSIAKDGPQPENEKAQYQVRYDFESLLENIANWHQDQSKSKGSG